MGMGTSLASALLYFMLKLRLGVLAASYGARAGASAAQGRAAL